MTKYSDSRSCVFYLLCVIVVYVSAEDECDKSKCPGPLKHYESLDCKPIYANPGDCCAMQYDCSHLKNLAKDKCYVNGHEYEIGEALRPEDANPCDINCTCTSYDNEDTSFMCAFYDCPFHWPKKHCFYKNDHNTCCPASNQVCLKEGETRAICEVDGIIYREGEKFISKSNPGLNCFCMPGYKGENVEPFCKKPNRPYCSPLFRHAIDVRENCAPIFYDTQTPQKDCSVFFKCQDVNDTVIHNHDSTKSISEEEDKMCVFGNMKMHIGDELSHDSSCMKCVCEVPPIPTCQEILDDKCNVVDK